MREARGERLATRRGRFAAPALGDGAGQENGEGEKVEDGVKGGCEDGEEDDSQALGAATRETEENDADDEPYGGQ